MDKERHTRNYDLHSWVGVVFGLFIYAIAITGCFALFYQELGVWVDPAKRIAVGDEPAPIHDAFSDWVTESTSNGEELGFASLTYPSHGHPFYLAYIDVSTETDSGRKTRTLTRHWNGYTGEPIPDRGDGPDKWLYDFHRNLAWPEAWGPEEVGRSIVGIAGAFLMLLVFSGVIAHTKLLPELFTLRFYKSMRLRWQDTHKIVGLWGLPFSGMISLTGAIIGLGVTVIPAMVLLSFQGDVDVLTESLLGGGKDRAGIAAPMQSLDQLPRLAEQETGLKLDTVGLHRWGDETALFDLYFEPQTALSFISPTNDLPHVEAYQINGVSGERIEDSRFETVTPAIRVLNMAEPLHYASFGSTVLKLVYFALGLSLAIITALGLMMWIERRLHGNVGKRSQRLYQSLSRVTVGVCCGLPVSALTIFYTDKLISVSPGNRFALTAWIFFLVWLAGVVYSFWRRNDYVATREMLFSTAALSVGLPLLNLIATGDFFLANLSGPGVYSGWVDLCFLSGGAGLAWVVSRLPSERFEKAAKRKAALSPEKSPSRVPAE